MLYKTPLLTPELKDKLEKLDELRGRLGDRTGNPGPWLGQLRRQVRASTAQSSISIEGYRVDDADAVALVSGERAHASDDEHRLAFACYARAMDHVGTMAIDPSFRWLDRVILDLHFDACLFQRDKGPGLWRTGPIFVTAPRAGSGAAYEGPDGVSDLMEEVVDWLTDGDLDTHVVVRAAMSHLHVVSVHPFRDGNGRISRIVQSLVLARDGLLSPEFSSIEEYLGAHTGAYYDALTATQGGSYQPDRDATRWVEFCIDAHLHQAEQRLAQVEQAAARWAALERLVDDRGWPDRLVIALEQSLFGGTDRGRYSTEADVSLASASNDLRRLLDAGLLTQQGQGRNTRYVASDALRDHPSRPSGLN